MTPILIAATEGIMTAQEALSTMGDTFWALLPALLAIILALVTKEVYISLFLGIFTGGMIFAKGNPIRALEKIFNVMAGSMSSSGPNDAGNAGILIFILELGILIAMINKAGGAKAFGRWVHTHTKSRRGALLATTGLGCIMFMDDYFNRLTVGSIMQPINDQFRISRAKTAFIVGGISVSICILIPVSSWASAIASNVTTGLNALEQSGATNPFTDSAFNIYVSTIFANFYPILLLLFLIVTSVLGINMFGLLKHEKTAIETGDVLNGLSPSRGDEDIGFSEKGRVIDLVLPILVLVASCCVFLLIKKDGEVIFPTNTALDMGGCIAIIFCMLLYLPRRLMSLKEYTSCFTAGFKSIADVMIILVFAWGLVGMCNELNLESFVSAFATWMQGLSLHRFLPAVLFLAAMGCAFATGTSWGTFGIMVPIVVAMANVLGADLTVITMSAVLSGSVFGDQVSPISDATILAAASCKSNHLGYVNAQLPNALLIAGIAFVCFLITGLTEMIWVGWIVGIVLFIALILTVYFIQRKNGTLADTMYKKAMAAESESESKIDASSEQPTAE